MLWMCVCELESPLRWVRVCKGVMWFKWLWWWWFSRCCTKVSRCSAWFSPPAPLPPYLVLFWREFPALRVPYGACVWFSRWEAVRTESLQQQFSRCCSNWEIRPRISQIVITEIPTHKPSWPPETEKRIGGETGNLESGKLQGHIQDFVASGSI